MEYDTIKLLNLEDVNIDLTKSHVNKANGYKNFDRFRKRVFFSLNKNTPIKGKKKQIK